ncbi:winged helix-turn-helix domain-containing protein [Pseudarthrobacter sp. MDT1-22]
MTNLLMNKTRSRLLHFLSKSGPSTSKQISTGSGLSLSTVQRQLALLRQGGFVDLLRVGGPRSSSYAYANNTARIIIEQSKETLNAVCLGTTCEQPETRDPTGFRRCR